jgi:Zinc carboxypeptidase
MRPFFFALVAMAGMATATAASPDNLTTVAERSGFQKTGRYVEVMLLCDAFAKRYPKAVRCSTFGTTPEGRPMQVMAVSTSGALTAERARARNLPVVLVQGGIHSGEIDGKDATFALLKDLLASGKTDVLRRQVLLFVPVFNIDGHERFGPNNRPNQRGPVEMGWRTTAQNFNLNREYLKADAPEMQAMHRLMRAWDPLAVIDLHVTNGAQFEHDVSIQVEPLYAGDEQLRAAGKILRDGVIADLARQGSLPLPFYPAFVESDNPASGIRDGVPPPRLSNGYFWLRNRFGMLVETHSWKDYPTRVRATRHVVESVLAHTDRYGAQWLKLARDADTASASLAGATVALTYRTLEDARTMDFRGYAYTRTLSEVSGAMMTRYDETRPQIWTMPVRDVVVPDMQLQAPLAGYVVPPQYRQLVEPMLVLHGIRYRPIIRALEHAPVEVFRATKATSANRSIENRLRMTLEGSWRVEQHPIREGSLYIPINQPTARVLMQLLEPRAPDSLAAWGAFNIHFERREYMEPYVAEAQARLMLAADPALKTAFETRLKNDAEFAASASARLDFFYMRHPAWDARFNLYPIVRVDIAPQ